MLSFLYYQASSASTETVDQVMLYITVISLILLFGITAVMIYFVFKYHRKKGHKPKDIHGNVWLEILWIGIPTILVLTMFYYGYTGFRSIRNIPEDAFEIDVKARMWEWQFDYANGKQTDTLYVPLNKYVKLNMESMDVNHSLYIPAFRIKEDVIAGKINYLAFKADKPGSYNIACAEYCGLNHSDMYTAVIVLPERAFEAWYGENPFVIDSATIAKMSDHEGVKLLKENNCVDCHSLDGSESSAKSFAGMLGRKAEVSTYGVNQEVTMDESFLRQTLMKPHRDVSDKYSEEELPDMDFSFTENEISAIIDALKGLN